MELRKFNAISRMKGICPSVFPNKVIDKNCFVSDSLYDQNKMVTHCILKSVDSDCKDERVVSDVELAMSDSPEITSLMSSEYRRQLQLSLQNQPKSPRDKPISDDELIKFNDLSSSLERPDLESVIRSKHSSFYSDAVSKVFESQFEHSSRSVSSNVE